MPPLKSILKPTAEQMKEIIRRVLTREAKLTPKAVESIMRFEPPVTRTMGTLAREVRVGPKDMVKDQLESNIMKERLPIDIARARYAKSPDSYVYTRGFEPSTKEVAQIPETPMRGAEFDWQFKPPPAYYEGIPEMEGITQKMMQQNVYTPMGGSPAQTPEELAKRIAYERLEFEPIKPRAIPPPEPGKGPPLKRAYTPKPLPEQTEVLPETMVPEVRAPIDIVTLTAQKAAELWKGISIAGRLSGVGGYRTAGGKMWQDFYEHSRGSVKKHFTDGRDYFISTFNRWYMASEDPKEYSRFLKEFPREARILEEMRRDKNLKPIFMELDRANKQLREITGKVGSMG